MPTLRLAIVMPRFWPLVDDRTLHALRLGDGLTAAGCHVTVVTPRWTRAWPERMALGSVDVVRLPGSAGGRLGRLRWAYALARWLRRGTFSAVLVAGLKREATIALSAAAERRYPVILLAGEDDLAWQLTAAGLRAKAQRPGAGAVVAASQRVADELVRAGYLKERLVVIRRAALAGEPRSAAAREAARLSLAAVNYDLATTANSVVALAVGRLDEAQRFGDLVRAWRIVTARRPEAKLWIVGDGPQRQQLYQLIGDLDQRFRVMLPGMFERLDELLAASDLVLVPAPHAAPPLVLLDAMAAGLPVVAAQSGPIFDSARAPAAGVYYPAADVQALAEGVLQVIDRLSRGASVTSCASDWTVADEAAEYLKLVERLQSTPEVVHPTP